MTDAAVDPPGRETLDFLLDRRLVLVTGKGGVGRSTTSLAIARGAAREGRSVLLIELSARAIAGDVFEGVAPKHEPALVDAKRYPGLWVAHLGARQALREYLAEALKVKRLAALATDNRVLARLWQAAPSVDEMALLTAIQRHVEARSTSDRRRPRFDLVVVDMPATGHARAMLEVPRGAAAMIRVGALADRARAIDVLLHDKGKTSVVIVTLPEELPINESVQMAERLSDDLDLDISAMVINAVLPAVFDSDERALVERLLQSVTDEAGTKLLLAATRRSFRGEKQAERVRELMARFDTRFVQVPFFTAPSSELVERVAEVLFHSGPSRA